MNRIQQLAAYVPYMTCPGNHGETVLCVTVCACVCILEGVSVIVCVCVCVCVCLCIGVKLAMCVY